MTAPGPTQRTALLVERLKVVLPIAILLFVAVHQAWEAGRADGWPSAARFAEGLLIYGLVGPLVTYWTLDWIGRALSAQVAYERRVEELNRALEASVAERTQQLEAATEELRAKNDALLAANAELMQLDALKDEFVDLVSHELRAPLTNINASVELLLGGDLAPEAEQKLAIIGLEASRLTRLVQSVLDISRMEAGQLEIQAAPVDVEALCEGAVRRLAATLPMREWRVNVASGTPAVLADADRAEQVLRNLLENAAKYSGDDTPVEVAAVGRAGEAVVRFAVSDRGVGIPPEEIERVFERFHRVERGAARVTYGHGLGLYIARKLVELHGGRIWAESTMGEGSTVFFELPAAPEEA